MTLRSRVSALETQLSALSTEFAEYKTTHALSDQQVADMIAEQVKAVADDLGAVRQEVTDAIDQLHQAVAEDLVVVRQEVSEALDQAAQTISALDERLVRVEEMAHTHDQPTPPPQGKSCYIHLAWKNPDDSGIPRSAWPSMIKTAIALGIATGAAMYSSGRLVWDSTWQAFFAAFPDGVDLFMMPVDPAGAVAFLSNLNDQQRAKIIWSNGQEREDQETTSELRAAFRQRSRVLWTEIGAAGWRWNPITKTGVRCAVEMNGWVTYAGTHGGIATQIEMIDPTVLDFIGVSAFAPGGSTIAETVLRAWQTAWNDHWSSVPWGWVAGGITVPPGTEMDSTVRETRAIRARSLFATALELGSETYSWYDVYHFSTGDYGATVTTAPGNGPDEQLILAIKESRAEVASKRAGTRMLLSRTEILAMGKLIDADQLERRERLLV